MIQTIIFVYICLFCIIVQLLPGRTTVTEELKPLYDEHAKQVTEKITDWVKDFRSNCSLTTDLFTEKRTSLPYIGLTYHYIEPCVAAHKSLEETLHCDNCISIKHIKLGAEPVDGLFEESKDNNNNDDNIDGINGNINDNEDDISISLSGLSDGNNDDDEISDDNNYNDNENDNGNHNNISDDRDIRALAAAELDDELEEKVLFLVDNLDLCF